MASYTITALKRWSSQDKQMPVFLSPLPNPRLWHGHTIGFLQALESFANGGWWHDKNILEATGHGMEKEEERAWEGWWNEEIVKLVELSMRQEDVMTVLLTGRARDAFADTIRKMVAAKKLDFDMLCLKPTAGPNGQRFASTQLFKQALLRDVILTYKEIEEVKIYEDRPKHVAAFRKFIDTFKQELRDHPSSVPRRDLAGEVIHVTDTTSTLDPVAEIKEVQRILNTHNLSNPQPRLLIKRTVFFLGYLLSQRDTDNLLTLLPPLDAEAKLLGNNIMITPRPSTNSVLDKVGGMGAKQIWQVTGFGHYNNLVFAVRVAPIPSSATYFTENPVPMVVLACKKGGKAVDSTKINHWQTVTSDKQFVFETTVGEKVQLRIEEEREAETEYESLFPPKSSALPFPGGAHQRDGNKRKQPIDENERPGRDEGRRVSDRYRGSAHPHRGTRGGGGLRERDRERDRDGGYRGPPPQGRGGRGGNRGSERDRDRRDGGRERERDRDERGSGRRGGRNPYRSLDDVADGPRSERYQNGQPSYDDTPMHNGPDAYGTNFPPLGAQGRNAVANGGYDGGEDLHY